MSKSIRELLNEGLRLKMPEHELLQLLSAVTNLSRSQLLMQQQTNLSKEQYTVYCKYLLELSSGKPLAYVIGKKYFWESEFKVNEHTLIPRDDSESLIRATLHQFPKTDARLSILDLGTGSGCLILTLLRIYTNAHGVAADISPDALAVAMHNGADVAHRCEFIISNWFAALHDEKFDIIISNPPYIAQDYPLEQQVHKFEPHSALFADNGGLSCYQEIAQSAHHFMHSDSRILLEIGYDQEQSVKQIFSSYSFVEAYKDLAGITRCLVFKI